AEMVLNDERAAVPIGSYQKTFGVTLSLPSIVGRRGVIEVLEPDMSDAEREGLRKSADSLNKALQRVRKQPRPKIAAGGCAPTAGRLRACGRTAAPFSGS